MRTRYIVMIFVFALATTLAFFVSPPASKTNASEKAGEYAPVADGVSYSLILPLIYRSVIPPQAPQQWGIDNSDSNNTFRVSWQETASSQGYTLEEATNDQFANAQIVYQGSDLFWDTPSGKTPNTYYYRLRAWNEGGQSAWSDTQYVQIYPFYIGLTMRWDGQGFIRVDESFNVGTHWEMAVTELTSPDIGKFASRFWYDPNPQGWEDTQYNSFYRLSSGEFLSSSVIDNPDWKWYNPWFLSYNYVPAHNQTAYFGGQPFSVTGPYDGVTAFGKPYSYWQVVNQQAFLYHDNGGEWTQQVLPGDAVLRYDAGPSRLQTYSDIRRTFFYNGEVTEYTVRYIEQLTAAGSFGAAIRNAVSVETVEVPPDVPVLPLTVPAPFVNRMHH